MRYILSAFLAAALFVGYEFIDLSKKLATANALAQALKASNMKLTKRNKALVTKAKHVHKRVSNRRIKRTKANLKKVQAKFATAGAKMAPFLGIPVVVGATAYDINDYCSEIDEMEQFEYELFGDLALSDYNKTVCGVDVEAKLQATASSVTQSYEKVLQEFNDQEKSASNYWSQKYKESTKFLEKESQTFNAYWDEKYAQTLKYLSEQNSTLLPFWKQEYEAFRGDGEE